MFDPKFWLVLQLLVIMVCTPLHLLLLLKNASMYIVLIKAKSIICSYWYVYVIFILIHYFWVNFLELGNHPMFFWILWIFREQRDKSVWWAESIRKWLLGWGSPCSHEWIGKTNSLSCAVAFVSFYPWYSLYLSGLQRMGSECPTSGWRCQTCTDTYWHCPWERWRCFG